MMRDASECAMQDGSTVRLERTKGERDAVPGMAAALAALSSPGGDKPLHPEVAAPADTNHELELSMPSKLGFSVSIVGCDDGRAWARGTNAALAMLAWPAGRWGSAVGRTAEACEGGWAQREAELEAVYAGWKRPGGIARPPACSEPLPNKVASPQKKEAEAPSKKSGGGRKRKADPSQPSISAMFAKADRVR